MESWIQYTCKLRKFNQSCVCIYMYTFIYLFGCKYLHNQHCSGLTLQETRNQICVFTPANRYNERKCYVETTFGVIITITSDHVCVCCRKYDYLFGWILVGTSWLTFCNIQLRALDRQGGYPLRCRCTEWSGLKNKTVTSVTETKIKANYNHMILMLTVSSIIVVLMAFTLTLYMLWIMNRISKYVFMPNSQYIQEAYRLSCINTMTSCGMLCI